MAGKRQVMQYQVIRSQVDLDNLAWRMS